MEDMFKQHGAFSWAELMTTDVEAAKRFYGELFGWSMKDMPMEGISYTVVRAGGREIGGIMSMPPGAQGMPPTWGNYVTVDDVDETVRKVVELGGSVVAEPRDIPDVGRFCVIRDPQGAFISAISYND